MMMSLGVFAFSIRTAAYTDLNRQMSWRHPGSERVGARSATQFTGPGDDTISLSGLIAPDITGSQTSLDVLRDMAEQGRAWPLVDGTGTVFGAYVIEAINETQSLFFRDGTPRRREFQINLKRAGE